MARILEWFAFPPPGDHVLSELSAVTCLSYNACLIASLGFTNPFAMTRLWSMKGNIHCSPEYSLEGLMLKLKLQYFDHLIQSADSLAKILILGKMEDERRDSRR